MYKELLKLISCSYACILYTRLLCVVWLTLHIGSLTEFDFSYHNHLVFGKVFKMSLFCKWPIYEVGCNCQATNKNCSSALCMCDPSNEGNKNYEFQVARQDPLTSKNSGT